VTWDERSLSIVVADDGCGSAVSPRSDGMGWRTMRYRAKLIGADVKVQTKPPGGTSVHCILPRNIRALAAWLLRKSGIRSR